MQILLNGAPLEVHSTLLDDILQECDYGNAHIAIVLNGVVIHRENRVMTELVAGDRLEILAPIGGG